MFSKIVKVKDLEYSDIGCGPNTSSVFVNLDYLWSPQIDVCWDLTKKNYLFPKILLREYILNIALSISHLGASRKI